MTATVERPTFVRDDHLEYLDDLRGAGELNMMGAAPYLRARFHYLSYREAIKTLGYWMMTFTGVPRKEEKWEYERLGTAIDALTFPGSEEDRIEYRVAVLAIFEEAGWTDEEWDKHLEKLLNAKGFFDSDYDPYADS